MSFNKAQVLGRLGRDPELRYTQSGKPVANLNVATNRWWKNADGQTQEETEWHRVVAWGRTAETCQKYLSKGRQVFVEGRLQTRKWEDREGVTKYTTEIVAETVKFVDGAADGNGGGSGRGEPGGAEVAGFDRSFEDEDIPF